jgi:hypothetical protein
VEVGAELQEPSQVVQQLAVPAVKRGLRIAGILALLSACLATQRGWWRLELGVLKALAQDLYGQV